MLRFIRLCFGTLVRLLRTHRSLLLENLALRQQLVVLKRRHPRPRLCTIDKLFWVLVCKLWSGWKHSLIVVNPDTVVRWHRAGFRLYWAWLSRHRVRFGRKHIRRELRDLIFDRDTRCGSDVAAMAKAMGILPKKTSYRSPWQNGVAERWVESCRRDLLDHVIVLNERHLKRLLSEYVRYYHEDRTHLGLGKETPGGRLRSVSGGRVIGRAWLGGLHHRYDRAA